jgi:transglutaminase-like putative cysteine protease
MESENTLSAEQVLAQRTGDCTENSLLFVAMARAVGIPARQAVGLLYHRRPRPSFSWHAWAEIHDGRQWISVDPSWDEVYVDAAHVKLGDSLAETGDRSWVILVGSTNLKVLDSRSSSRKK